MRRRFGELCAALVSAVGLCSLGACGDEEPSFGGAFDAGLSRTTEAIIYGNDDRLEVYQEPDAGLRALAQASVLAVVPLNRFARNGNGDLSLFSFTLADAFGVCADQRFATQLTAADCSAVLIDDDLVLTAGHCFDSDADCNNYAFIFDYYFRAANTLESISWGDIYGCRGIVARQLVPRGGTPRDDYTVLQLDRPAAGRTPVSIRTSPLNEGEETTVIGCPSGLPFKIDTGGEVLSTRAPAIDYFILDSDTFQGSSGSGVFDANNQLIGTLVRGGDDYTPFGDGGCVVPNVVTRYEPDASLALNFAPDGGMIPVDAEEATYVARAIEGVCTSGWPSERLCARPPTCGDGFCSADETRINCAADCACAYGACLDGGNYPAASTGSRAHDKSRAEGGSACSALGTTPAVAWPWLATLLGLAVRRRRLRTA